MPDSTSRPPPTGRRERKRQRMASHLAATAFELFEEHGYDAVTMEQVAEESDVAKATLYSYFPMKEALVAHRFREEIIAGMDELTGALQAHDSFASRMRFLLRESAAWHEARRVYMPHYLRYMNTRAGTDEARADTGSASSVTWDILTDMFRVAQQSGEVVRSVAAEKLSWSLQFLLYGAVTAWLAQPETDLTDEFLLAFELLSSGVDARRRPRTRARDPSDAGHGSTRPS